MIGSISSYRLVKGTNMGEDKKQRSKKKVSWFSRFAQRTSQISGTPVAFGMAVLIIVVWLISGPVFGFSDTWQLIINTGTTIITFLMVFLIQSTQNRDSEALQLKLDELIRAASGAHNALLNLEELEQGELDKIRERYVRLAEEARQQLDLLDDDEHPAVDQRKSTEGEAS